VLFILQKDKPVWRVCVGKLRLPHSMKIIFDEVRNQQIKTHSGHLEVGDLRFESDDQLEFDDPPGEVSVQSIREAAEQFIQLTNDECPVQLGILVFAATRKSRALDFYFPITQMLDEVEIQRLAEVMQSIAWHPNFDLQLIGEKRLKLTAQMPSGIREIVAGQIAEVFFYRKELLEHFLATPRRIQLYVSARAFQQDGGLAGGDYNPRRQSIQLVLSRLFEGFFGETAGVCPFLHELGHMLDDLSRATGITKRSEGLLPGLSPKDGRLFSPRARELFISGKRLELERYLALCRGTARATDPLPIGHPYVFQNNGEFIAGYFEMFFRNPNYFAARNPDLYAAFVELFGYDPREAWTQDFPFYVNQNRDFYLSGERPPKPGLTVPEE
jgi:hypothetical protein